MFILVPRCGVVDDVLASAIQFGVIANDALVIVALPPEIDVGLPATKYRDCGLVGSHNDSQGVAMRRNQRIPISEVARRNGINVLCGRVVQLNHPTMEAGGSLSSPCESTLSSSVLISLLFAVGAF